MSRPSLTPMDFEYDNQTGQVDPESPFMKAVNQPAKKRKLDFFGSKHPMHEQHLTSGPPSAQTGTHSVLDSPSKGGFATPSRPQLREPHNERFLFSSTGSKPLPSIPRHVSPWEPRTPASIIDCSSGGETPNTPAQDSDAATPDTQLASSMRGLSHGEQKSPRKSKRNSLFKLFQSSPSPSKEKPYSKKAERRVMKRRSKKAKTARDGDDDSDDEMHGNRDISANTGTHSALGFVANIPGVLAWVEAHPGLPAVLSYYMQFVINTALGLFFLWIIYAGYAAVVNDIDVEAQNKARDIMYEIAVCTDHYFQNQCDSSRRLPALLEPCQNWEKCMKRDAHRLARASVGARTFAMIFNSFVEEFSYKAMLFTAIVLFGGFNLSNWAFGLIREKEQRHPQHYDYPPATPQRYPSNGFIEHGGWGNAPYGTPYGSMNQHMLQQATQSLPALPSTAEQEEYEKSPSKRGIFRR